jgi:hypothetical protein
MTNEELSKEYCFNKLSGKLNKIIIHKKSGTIVYVAKFDEFVPHIICKALRKMNELKLDKNTSDGYFIHRAETLEEFIERKSIPLYTLFDMEDKEDDNR